MSLRLPSRYEDLDFEFRGRLRPNVDLLDKVKYAFKSMEISGGIRFLPVYGNSGSGKTSSVLEIGTHLPDLNVLKLSRESIESNEILLQELRTAIRKTNYGLVAAIDQYEEVAAERLSIPKLFVEFLSILDRGDLRNKKILFIWLTTSKEFQSALVEATTRNKRILVSGNYAIESPPLSDWSEIINETFQFHNKDKHLSDYGILDIDLEEISQECQTIGDAIEQTGQRLDPHIQELHDLSDYQLIMLWPVTDGLRITRIQQFTDPKQGYKLDWPTWYRQLNETEQARLPLREFNRARLYFDIRLIPIAAADLHPLCRELENEEYKLHTTYLDRFKHTHFYSVATGNWNPSTYSPLRERESKRATEAKEWYTCVTRQPTLIGKRIASCFNALDIPAKYEQTIKSVHSEVRADILMTRRHVKPTKVIIELKAYSDENTMPSSICSAVQTTLRRHAQFAGFLQKQ